MGDFRKLRAWQRAQGLAAAVYRISDRLPGQERFGLMAQMRRAALSVSSNLAEGCGRRGDRELRRFTRISQGSLAELECQVLLARELLLLQDRDAESLLHEIHEVRGMLEGLHRSLNDEPPRRSTLDPRPSTP